MGCAPSSTVQRCNKLEQRVNELQQIIHRIQKDQEGKGKDKQDADEHRNIRDTVSESTLPGTVNASSVYLATAGEPTPATSSNPWDLQRELEHQAKRIEAHIKQTEEERNKQQTMIEQLQKEIVAVQQANRSMNSAVVPSSTPSPSPLDPSSGNKNHPLPIGTLSPPTHIPTTEEKKSRRIEFDVFLSHKRTDSADFARTLKTELTDLCHMKCFLDQDADFELGDLMSKVRGSRTLIFILSDNILLSEWCILELREAILWDIEIILLTSHGAKWIVDGHTHDFPPAKLIRPEIAPAFANKAIEYNRNFHKASIEQLVLRLYGKPPQVAMVEWQVPACPQGENPSDAPDAEFSLDLSTLKSGLPLPSAHPIQVLHSVTHWRNESDRYAQIYSHSIPPLPKPFAVRDADDGGKLLLSASARSARMGADPTYADPFQTRTALIVDGPSAAVQTGTVTFEGERYSVQFSSVFRAVPMVWCTVVGSSTVAQSSNNKSEPKDAIVVVHAVSASVSGFDLWYTNACSIVPPAPRKVQVSWLAFDPRVVRGWTCGEFLEVKDNPVTPIRFNVNGQSCMVPRDEFTRPPLIFLGYGGGRNFDLANFHLTATDVTVDGCMIHHHDPSAVHTRMMMVRWIAIAQ